MSTEILTPFQLTPSGGVAAASVPADQVQQHLQALVSTTPGERVMQPAYGVALANALFGLGTAQTAAIVSTDVQAAIAKWEPNVNIQDVRTSVGDTSLGIVAIDVDYSPGSGPPSPNAVQTCTVLVGGSVIAGRA